MTPLDCPVCEPRIRQLRETYVQEVRSLDYQQPPPRFSDWANTRLAVTHSGHQGLAAALTRIADLVANGQSGSLLQVDQSITIASADELDSPIDHHEWVVECRRTSNPQFGRIELSVRVIGPYGVHGARGAISAGVGNTIVWADLSRTITNAIVAEYERNPDAT